MEVTSHTMEKRLFISSKLRLITVVIQGLIIEDGKRDN